MAPPRAGSWPEPDESADNDDEAALWAEVVASALDTTPARSAAQLALAGEEIAPPSAAPHAAHTDAPAADLDKLADSVYTIIRRRLEIERERDWA